ncbi:beta-ketoacyl synthase N-terminal-like domain-containing protein [Mycobacterium riyadhense]|uniref:hotdog fold thioesterase n=1 Tax=Mycobacterium riyadhense TaxID=486698 RepID=UPI00194EA4DF|nr:beta-ketoacyl synthase N-terminal-like domain-containing protein [Mycobacterium riyadhense]
MIFEPIAIVGQGCVFPGGLSPAELWTTIVEGRDVLGGPPPGLWGMNPANVLQSSITAPFFDHTWSDRGGYVRGFDDVFDTRGFALEPDQLTGLDPLFLWTMYAARQAVESAGWTVGDLPGRAGVVLGNLSYPTRTMTALAERVWRGDRGALDWRNRFTSGLPAHLVARALGVTGGAFSLDAACASSLYAIKLACDRLHDHTADMMLAGGVNRADDLFLHVGFSALQALSRSGTSRPFHRQADGLVPAEGAGFIALRRLDDAIAAGERILGVIRGVGLANDGRGQSLLTPSQRGQEGAMCAAYQMAGLDPKEISLVECHATGTPLGDLVELRGMARIFAEHHDLPIGSLKSNLGHSITASGIAGVIKVVAAIRAGVRPPTLHVEDPVPFVGESPFRLLTHAEPWSGPGPRRAAINNFGFGGNNAHVIIEEWIEPAVAPVHTPWWRVRPRNTDVDVAIVGLSVLLGNGHDTAAVADHLVANRSLATQASDGVARARAESLCLDVTQVRFPPNDLKDALPQQTAVLSAALNIAQLIKGLPSETTGVLMGMGCDAEIARWGLRWRLADEIDDPQRLAAARDDVVGGLVAASVVGAMPNMVANRLNSQFDLRGLSLTVSREQLSGSTALELAARALRHGDTDAMVVGAVDLSCEPVHEAAARELLGPHEQTPADAAVIMVLKRAEDARRDNDTIYALLGLARDNGSDEIHIGTGAGAFDISSIVGHAHAASGLLQVAAGVLFGFLGVKPGGLPWTPQGRAVVISLDGLGGEHQQIRLVAPPAVGTDLAARRAALAQAIAAARGRPHNERPLDLAGHMPPVRLQHIAAGNGAEPQDNPSPRSELIITMPAAPVLAKASDADSWTPLGDALIVPNTPQQLRIPMADPQSTAPQAAAAGPTNGEAGPAAGSPSAGNGAHRANQPLRPADKRLPEPTAKRNPMGLKLDKAGLRVHAAGKISEVFGPAFAVQDDYPRQTRMPEPPLLLADRLLGIDAEPGRPGTGTLWTETDVTADAWWLHAGRMPAGVMIESGQADLMLISWMGADLANKGERVYRLLGCELTFLGGLPEIGDTLRFDIHVDGHARQGGIRLFFFHYDCVINGAERLSVRCGQAGFFSDDELAASGGILWRPQDETITGRLDAPPCPTSRRSLTRAELNGLADGKVWQTMGSGFERAASHTRTPTVPSGDMLFLDEVTTLDFAGGPWGRGYLRAVQHIEPETWFFKGHFKNDPCMPGTLMFEGTLQSLAVYMTAAGMTLGCDGWRFEPVPFETYKLRCRGQVTPSSREVVYEVFVRELVSDREPTLFADVLCTVDGLPAFHCSRLGLKLSPGWAMDQGLRELEGFAEPKPVAQVDGFAFDYRSLLACALGRPSTAFGPIYERFDTYRKGARLPSPPYHFMSRITEVVGQMGSMDPSARVVAEYDVPRDAWYFAANGVALMPYSVLMEVCLQPCGWLSTYVGCSLTSETDLFFRNLDGTGVQHGPVDPSTGTLRTEARLTNIAKVGDTIIVSFALTLFAGDTLVYDAKTVFGYFAGPALDQQVGLPATDAARAQLTEASQLPAIDLTTRPDGYFGPGARLADPMLLMIDRVTGRWPTAGNAGLGRWRAVKDVDPGEWFFKAHFFQDPVQPGSLGIEGLLELLQFAMLDLGLGSEAGPDAHFEPIAIGEALTWRYRGQVRPHNKVVNAQVEITRLERGEDAILAVADGSLWVDGLRIYSVTSLGMRIRRNPTHYAASEVAASPAGAQLTAAHTGILAMETSIDPGRDTWIGDHRPSYTTAAMPMMSVLDLIVRAASRAAPESQVIEVTDLQVMRWVVVDKPKRLRAQVQQAGPGHVCVRVQEWRDATNPALSRWEALASATVTLATSYPGGPQPPAPLDEAIPMVSPYQTGAVFHGPAFQSLKDGALLGRNGATGVAAVDRCAVPTGCVHPGLLDAGFHIVPHTAMSVWTTPGCDLRSYTAAADETAGFPHHIPWARFYSDPPQHGEVSIEARFVGFEDPERRMPMVDLWFSVGDQPWAQIRVVEVLLPKSSVGRVDGVTRAAFLGERRAVPGLTLGIPEGRGGIRLDASLVAQADWLKGTVRSVYLADGSGEALVAEVAAKEAVAHAAHGAIHPSRVVVCDGRAVCPALPLERITLDVERLPQGRVRARASLDCDWEPARQWWSTHTGSHSDRFDALLTRAMLSRYVRHVIVDDPAAFAKVRGRSVLLLANHQVQIESLLGTVIASYLTDTIVLIVSNQKHHHRWLGQLSRALGGGQDHGLRNILYFDQSKPGEFFTLLDRAKQDMARRGSSLMVHAAGTRQTSSRQRVSTVTSKLLDLAVEMALPIVPVHFAGGLPEEPLPHKLEFPYRHAAQDYICGAPIMPDDLAALPYAQRRTRVLQAINALAPISDAPHQPDLAAHERIAAATSGLSPREAVWATLEDALEALPIPWRQAPGADQWSKFPTSGSTDFLDEFVTGR